MKSTRAVIILSLIAGLAIQSRTQDYVHIDNASAVEVYKAIDDIELKAWIFDPEDHEPSDQKSAIVFFFGGGWATGTPSQFAKHCEYLSARGMVAMTVDYRVANRHGVNARHCVADAKSAIRWMRLNAKRLGIDPDRIVASGGSAGGHLAASTATLPGHDEISDYKNVSCVPNALALFNPALVLASVEEEFNLDFRRIENLAKRMGADPESLSPYHNIDEFLPPTIIFHGTADDVVDFKTAELFNQKMKALGNQCKLVSYEGEGHGFFNYLRKGNEPFVSIMQYLDAFLVDLGYLVAPPTSKVR